MLPPEAVRALKLQNLGNMRDAETYFKLAAQKYPRDFRVYYSLALLFTHENRLEEAEGAFREAAKLRPNHEAAWSALGAVLTRLV